MSGPPIYGWGAGSDEYQRQLNQFNATRDQFYSGFFNQAGARNGSAAPNAITMGQQPSAPMQQAQAIKPEELWDDADLLGAARFWGIPEGAAKQMPREALVAHIKKLRENARPDEQTVAGRMGMAGNMLMALPEMIGIGAAEAITGGLQRLPFIGGALKRSKAMHETDMFFRELEEGVRASTPDDFQWVNTATNLTGNLGALWFPGNAAWKLAGAMVPGRVASPMARAAIQGGAASWLLEGGSEHPGMAVGAGAFLGPAFIKAAPYLEAAATKITKRFVPSELIGGNIPDRPKLLMSGASDITRLVGAAQQGDPEALAMYRELYRQGNRELPVIPWDILPRGAGEPWRSPTAGYNPDVGLPPEILSASRGRGMTGISNPIPGLDVDGAETLANQMNKAATIIESSDLARAAKQMIPDEVSVAQAGLIGNPGGATVIEGIGDPGSFAQSVNGFFAFVQRRGRLGAIVSDAPITPRMIGEFEQHGMYSGQQALHSSGVEMQIESIVDDGTALVRPAFGSGIHHVPLSSLQPVMSSPGVKAVPELWAGFNNYAEQQAIHTQLAMGGALNAEQLSAIKTQNMAQWMDDFLDSQGIMALGDRARVKNYFNQEWVGSFAEHAPEAVAQNRALAQTAMEISVSKPKTPLGNLDEAAATKGFVVIPNGEGGYTLVNQATGAGPSVSPVSMQFDTAEAAETWIKKMSRELPDVSVNTGGIPGEVMGAATRNPPPEINVNARFENDLVGGMMEMGEGGVPPVPPNLVAEARAGGNFGALNNFWQEGFSRWAPQRTIMAKISDTLRTHLGDDLGVSKWYSDLGQLRNQFQFAQHAPQNELADIMSKVRTKKLLDGEWTRVYEILDDEARLGAAKKFGWNEEEIQSLGRFNGLMKSLFKETGLDPNRELRQYITHMQQKRSMGSDVPWDDFPVGPTTKPWWEMMRSGNMDVREMDPRRLGESYIRSVYWERHMAEPYNAALGHFKKLQGSEETQAAGAFMENWMGLMKNGYDPKDDIALDGIHRLGQYMIGKSFTRQQARELVSFGLGTTHASLLGFRAHVMARDALQLFFAIPRAGDDLVGVIGRYTTDPAFRKAVMQEALEEGAVAMNMPTMASPGQLAGELEASAAGMPREFMSKRMKAVGAIGSVLRDIAPDFMKGSSDHLLKPMYLYSKQGELMKSLVYQAGKQKANRALNTFRQAGPNGDLEKLMGDSGARTFDPAWQQRFKEIVASGDDRAASQFLGRQLADATQFKYGLTENPAVSRTVTGRLFMQFGSYQTQYLQYLRESLANGHISDKVKFAATAGAVSYGLKAASDETGWNFNYMNPYALGFAGGPWVSVAAGMFQGASAVARAAQDQSRPMDQRTLGVGGAAVGQAANMLNPARGLWESATAVGGAFSDSPDPATTLLKFGLTGERGAQQEILGTMATPQAMVPAPNPVRLNNYQLPQVPPQQPVFPGGVPQVGPPSVSGLGSTSFVQPQVNNRSDDSTFLQSVAYPQPGVASGYRLEDVQMALYVQDPNTQINQRIFSPPDWKQLMSLRGMPMDVAVEIFRDYLKKKILDQTSNGTGNEGGITGLVSPPEFPREMMDAMTSSGAGGQF